MFKNKTRNINNKKRFNKFNWLYSITKKFKPSFFAPLTSIPTKYTASNKIKDTEKKYNNFFLRINHLIMKKKLIKKNRLS